VERDGFVAVSAFAIQIFNKKFNLLYDFLTKKKTTKKKTTNPFDQL